MVDASTDVLNWLIMRTSHARLRLPTRINDPTYHQLTALVHQNIIHRSIKAFRPTVEFDQGDTPTRRRLHRYSGLRYWSPHKLRSKCASQVLASQAVAS